MALLEGKRIVVTGVLTDASLAYGVAELAIAEGAEVILTGRRGLSLTRRTARKLSGEPEVVSFDVTDADEAEALRTHLADTWGGVDGALHAIGFAPPAVSAATSCPPDGRTWRSRSRSPRTR
ncbi:MAG: SDR family oxidoreductase, partial [Acidimicrobiia bacterium]|nr:SDR family oxidoreductase [Acidimicrobiia bacterium]